MTTAALSATDHSEREFVYRRVPEIVTENFNRIARPFDVFLVDIGAALRLHDESERERQVRAALGLLLRSVPETSDRIKKDTCEALAEFSRRNSVLPTVRATPTEQVATQISEASFKKFDAAAASYRERLLDINRGFGDDAVAAIEQEGVVAGITMGAVMGRNDPRYLVGNAMAGAVVGAAAAELTEMERHTAGFRAACYAVIEFLDAVPSVVAPLVDHVLSLTEGGAVDFDRRDTVARSLRARMSATLADCQPVLGIGADVFPLSVPKVTQEMYFTTVAGKWALVTYGTPTVGIAVLFGFLGLYVGEFWCLVVAFASLLVWWALVQWTCSSDCRQLNEHYDARQSQIPATLAQCERALAALRGQDIGATSFGSFAARWT